MAFSSHHYLQELTALLAEIDHDQLERLARLLSAANVGRNTIFCCGNGGSAATAMHFAMDLAKLTVRPGRPRLRVLSLNDSVPTLTAIGNDFDYREVFVEQLATLMGAGDILIGFSTSGRSPNVLRAMEFANEQGAITIGFTGASQSPLHSLAQHVVAIPSTNVQRLEDVSMVMTHLLCMMTLERLNDASALAAPVAAVGAGPL